MNNKTEKQIGYMIKVLRTAAGIKQKDLATQAGIKPNYLSLVEAGTREPSLNVLRSISRALNVPISFLFWQESTEQEHLDKKGRNALNRIKQLLLEVESLRLSEENQSKSRQ